MWNVARKYHSGRIPGGTGANASALFPELPRIERRQGGEQGDGDIPERAHPEDVVGEERHLLDALSALDALRDRNRHAHALALHEEEMHADEQRRDGRKNRDVQCVEARQRRAGHIVTAAHEPHQRATDDRHGPGDAGARLSSRKTPARSMAADSR